MQIKLQSDFRDFYDRWFCGSHQEPDVVLNRMSEGEMSREDMFKIFEQHGLLPPKLLPEHPLLAVDLLPVARKVYAIDLNTAPGIKWTALEEQFSGKWIFEGIRSYCQLIFQAGCTV